MAQSIEEARQSVATARELLAQKRAQAEDVQRQLEEQDKALPSTTSAMSLRKNFAGMQGRIQRRTIETQREGIRENLGYVKNYQGDLSNYEQEINATESQINTYERRIAEAQADAREEAKAELEAYKDEFESANPGEKLIIDWNKLRVSGVSSGALSQSLSVDDYNKKIEQINSNIKEISSASSINTINTQLPRSDRISIPKNNNFQGGLFSSVSALEPSYVDDKGVYHGVVKKAPEPKNIPEKLKEYARIQPDTQIGVTKGVLAGGGSAFLSAASALGLDKPLAYHYTKKGNTGTINNIIGTAGFVGSRLKSNQYFPEAGQALSRVDQLTPYQTGYIGAEILSLKGTGAVARGLTKVAYKAADLPKVRTVFGAQEIGRSGNSVWLKTGAVSDVQGLLRTRKVASAAYTQVKQGDSLGDAIPFQSATLGVQRVKNLRGWSKPKGFGAGSTGVMKESKIIGEVGKVNGARISREIPVNQFQSLGFVKTSKKAKQVYNAMVGASRQAGEIDVVWGLSKPVIRKGKKLSLGSGSNRIFGIVKRTPEPSLNIWGNTIQTYKKGSSSIAVAEQKAAIEAAAKATTKRTFTKEMNYLAKTNAKVGSMASMLGLSTKTSKSTTSKVSSQSRQEVKPQTRQSIWYGTGQYEKTNESVASIPRERVNQTTRQREGMMSGFTEATGMKQPSASNQAFRINAAQKQRYAQRTQQKQAQTFNWLTGERITARATDAFHPSVSYKTKNGRILHSAPGRYLVIVKRYGKDSVIGEALTLQEAKRILSANLRESLAASGFVSYGGKKQDVSNMFGNMFTSAKKDRFRLVQKRGKRLSARSEVNEILGFGKRKDKLKGRRRIKWW